MAENDSEKTEQPSGRRREQARKEGNFASSKELSTFFVIVASVMVLYFSSGWMFYSMGEVMKKSFMSFKLEFTISSVSDLFKGISYKFLLIVLPALAIPIFGAISYVLQNGFMLTGKPLAFNFSKLNPISGVGRLFSLNSISELVKAILKISVLSYVVYGAVAGEWSKLPFLMDMEVVASAYYMAAICYKIMIRTVWVLAIIAIIDYAFQRWTFEKGLRMSKQELKEEMKEMEGDPLIKARIRSMQKEMARKRMMAAVPRADVVITNPTHLAVALKYDKKKGKAPMVVAKGAGTIAERIREIAKEHRVPIVENKPLARNLFKHVDIGKEIPATLYKAVAEILAYVFKLKGRRSPV